MNESLTRIGKHKQKHKEVWQSVKGPLGPMHHDEGCDQVEKSQNSHDDWEVEPEGAVCLIGCH